MSQFKVGDRVTLREDLVVGKKYGEITLLPLMRFAGEEEVISITRSHLVQLNTNSFHFYYDESMLKEKQL